MADEPEKKSEDKDEDSTPWTRMESMVRKVIGEELSKWEASPNDSKHSSEEPEKEVPPKSDSQTPPRKTGFLANFFGDL